MTRAIYPASFDPITCGHIDIAKRAARIFDELIVGVFSQPMKNTLFSAQERLQMTRDALVSIPNAYVESYSTLTVEFARAKQASVIVRGLRAASDFEWEFQLSLMNDTLEPEIDTICLMANQNYSFLSSSIVKDIARNNGSVDHLVPPNVVQALKFKLGRVYSVNHR